MLENHHRIEKEILLGRQAVRKTSRSRSRAPLPDPDEQLHINTSNNPKAHGLPRISVSPAPIGSDVPLSVDTDAEAAYANGTSFTRTSPTNISGASTPRASDGRSSRDPMRSPLGRRKRASIPLEPTASDAEASGGTDSRPAVPPTPRQNTQPTTPSSFFTRFRTQSFPTLSSPFSTFHRTKQSGKESSRNSIATHAWSSDSSSEEELTLGDQRHIHHPSTVSMGGLAHTDDEADDD